MVCRAPAAARATAKNQARPTRAGENLGRTLFKMWRTEG
jgi:hypothetical protein